MKFLTRLASAIVILVVAASLAIGFIPLSPAMEQDVHQMWHAVSATATDAWNELTNQTPTARRTAPTTQTSNDKATASSQSANVNATPLESIIQPGQLSNIYYYRFKTGTPKAVQTLFTRAVGVYNATGIVQLRAGSGKSTANRITFSVYHKTMSFSQQNTIELGLGGPGIVHETNAFQTIVYNHASAELNITYAKSISLAVAVHEIGHALGLDHSNDVNSVMYPLDRGVTTLSAGDIAALREIYTKQKTGN